MENLVNLFDDLFKKCGNLNAYDISENDYKDLVYSIHKFDRKRDATLPAFMDFLQGFIQEIKSKQISDKSKNDDVKNDLQIIPPTSDTDKISDKISDKVSDKVSDVKCESNDNLAYSSVNYEDGQRPSTQSVNDGKYIVKNETFFSNSLLAYSTKNNTDTKRGIQSEVEACRSYKPYAIACKEDINTCYLTSDDTYGCYLTSNDAYECKA